MRSQKPHERTRWCKTSTEELFRSRQVLNGEPGKSSLNEVALGLEWIEYVRFCYVLGTVTQSCPTLRDPMDCSPLGSSIHGISRQEYWSGLPCPLPGDLPDPGIELVSPVTPALQADSLSLSHRESPKTTEYLHAKEWIWNPILRLSKNDQRPKSKR